MGSGVLLHYYLVLIYITIKHNNINGRIVWVSIIKCVPQFVKMLKEIFSFQF